MLNLHGKRLLIRPPEFFGLIPEPNENLSLVYGWFALFIVAYFCNYWFWNIYIIIIIIMTQFWSILRTSSTVARLAWGQPNRGFPRSESGVFFHDLRWLVLWDLLFSIVNVMAVLTIKLNKYFSKHLLKFFLMNLTNWNIKIMIKSNILTK